MALKDSYKTIRNLLENIQSDLDKAEAGNKAAAQRVRTTSIRFEKAAKMFRKESIQADRGGSSKKKSGKASKAKASKAPAKKAAAARPAAKKAAPKKRATAKLPKKSK